VAIQRNVTRTDNVFTGEDKLLIFKIYQSDSVTPQNITGMGLSWMLKRNKYDSDLAAKVAKTIGNGISITGTFNADPLINTQQVEVTLSDDDTALLSSTIVYYHELKRTDGNVEAVLTYGTFALRQGVHR
jgi:hypothetical protein